MDIRWSLGLLVVFLPAAFVVGQDGPTFATCDTTKCPENSVCVDYGDSIACECTNNKTGENCTEDDPCREVVGPACPAGKRCFGACAPNVKCLGYTGKVQCSGCLEGWKGLNCDCKAGTSCDPDLSESRDKGASASQTVSITAFLALLTATFIV